MKIVDFCAYIASNPVHGGAVRVFNLNYFSKHQIMQFSFTPLLIKKKQYDYGYYTEQVTPKLVFTLGVILLKFFRLYSYDFILPMIFKFIRPSQMMCVEVSQADVVQVEHPWLFSWVKRHFPEKPIVLVEHNIETVTYQTLNACSLVNDRSIVKIVRTIESDAVRQADLIFCCSQEDRQNLAQYFDINPSIVNIVPNPVNVKKYVPVKNKSVLKSQLGFGNKTLILFAGSKHPPNQEALRIIEDKIAPAFEKRKDILFVVVGHVSKKKQEKNIYYTGFVKDVLPYYQAADLAIIPLVSGTGTSLKTLEFMSCALPVISTRVGSRGLKTRSNKELIIVNIESFPRQIRQLLKNPEFANKIGICGRKHVLKEFSNETVTAKMDRLYSLV